MKVGHLILAYHGCDITVRDDLVSGRISHLKHSKNKYDWLGSGAYFFENDAPRALMFADAAQRNPAKFYTRQPIATSAVVGAVLQVQHVLDMTTQEGIQEYILAYDAMVRYLMNQSKDIPENRKANNEDNDIIYRSLDRAVFEYIHQIRREENSGLLPFQAVRSAFPQGELVAPSSAFKKNSHVQIAVQDNSCVQGWFLPPGAQLLAEGPYEEAKQRLQTVKTAYQTQKPRVRAS